MFSQLLRNICSVFTAEKIKKSLDKIYLIKYICIKYKTEEVHNLEFNYQETMKRAIEDGINDANMATERYKAMTRQK